LKKTLSFEGVVCGANQKIPQLLTLFFIFYAKGVRLAEAFKRNTSYISTPNSILQQIATQCVSWPFPPPPLPERPAPSKFEDLLIALLFKFKNIMGISGQ
jgi:hypothetical protein